MIPKRIFYCWYGGLSNLPSNCKKCIDSWYKNLKGYEIIRLDESNSNLSSEFARTKFKNKEYAFLSDYVRVLTLLEQGGIYLDTDMFITKPFPEEMLETSLFVGAENSRTLGTAVIGSDGSNHPLLRLMKVFYRGNPSSSIPNTKILTNFFNILYNTKHIGGVTRFDDLIVYPSEYFYPVPLNHKNKLKLTSNTVGIHLWTDSSNQNVHIDKSFIKYKSPIDRYLSSVGVDNFTRENLLLESLFSPNNQYLYHLAPYKFRKYIDEYGLKACYTLDGQNSDKIGTRIYLTSNPQKLILTDFGADHNPEYSKKCLYRISLSNLNGLYVDGAYDYNKFHSYYVYTESSSTDLDNYIKKFPNRAVAYYVLQDIPPSELEYLGSVNITQSGIEVVNDSEMFINKQIPYNNKPMIIELTDKPRLGSLVRYLIFITTSNYNSNRILILQSIKKLYVIDDTNDIFKKLKTNILEVSTKVITIYDYDSNNPQDLQLLANEYYKEKESTAEGRYFSEYPTYIYASYIKPKINEIIPVSYVSVASKNSRQHVEKMLSMCK